MQGDASHQLMSSHIDPSLLECFIRYSSLESAQAALRLSGEELGDRKLVVTPVSSEDLQTERCGQLSHSIYIGNLPINVTEPGVSHLFYSEGLGRAFFVDLRSPKPQLSKFAFVEMESPKHAQKAAKTLQSFRFDGCELHAWSTSDAWSQGTAVAIPQHVSPSSISSDNPLYAGLSEHALRKKLEELKRERQSDLITSGHGKRSRSPGKSGRSPCRHERGSSKHERSRSGRRHSRSRSREHSRHHHHHHRLRK